MAVTSNPWAQVPATLPPMSSMAAQPQAPAPVFAPIPDASRPAPDLTQAMPQKAMFDAPDHRIDQDQARLEKIRWQEQNPWGTPENHPGLGGKVAHVFSRIGNIAGDIVAPNVMARIPGTELNREVQEQGLTNRLGKEEQEQSENQERAAQTANIESEVPLKAAETKKAQEEAESSPALSQAEIAKENAQASALLHPQAKTDFEAWQQQNPGKPIAEWLKTVAANKDTKPDPARQQLVDEYQKMHPGASLAAADRYASEALQSPQRAPVVQMFVPNGQGGETLQRIAPGQTVAPGAQTAAGLNSMNTPTTNQRTAAGRAETVIAMAPEVLSRIDSVAPKLGPIAGRWGEFMQGKVGSDDPDFAALRSDLLMMSSAVALAHAQGRLPENLREEFDHAINAPHQTPENLKATINTMIPWLQQVQSQGGHPGAAPPVTASQPTRPANVPEGYVFKDGPQGRGWYRPNAAK